MAKEGDELGIVPYWSVFRDRRLERGFCEFRRQDEVRATALALVMGGLAYAGASFSDAAVFANFPAELERVRLLRAGGVGLCLVSAALIWRLRSTLAMHALAALGMLGTLLSYSGIVYLQERLVGGADDRLVFSVFSLLAFIFFPLRVGVSTALVAGMLLNVVALHAALPERNATDLQRTIALMVTFAVAGASFSITNNRARRKEFELRRRREEALRELSREVQARRDLERELQRHRENLEQLVAERTLALEQSQAQLVAAQRVEVLGQLAGGLAHDFNNLLVTIMGNAELTLDHADLPSEARDNQENILAASKRASKLARDLLAGSRKQVMEFQLLDPATLLGGIEGILRTAVGQRASLSISGGPTPAIVAARGPLEQVLLNLVVNARDAAEPSGKIEVRVDTVSLDRSAATLPEKIPPGDFVRISVSDTGPGIPSELRERIFEPFFSTKEAKGGTGLGLSVVRGVVEQHGGFLLLTSELGKGTTFSIHLPTSEGQPRAELQSGRWKKKGGNETILVVDDDPLVLRLVRRSLEKAGYHVLAAGDGRGALEILNQHEPVDLVLSDLVMPAFGGRELMSEARKRGHPQPFLFSSGYSDGGVHRGFVLEPGIHFLAKPFTVGELERKVRQVLDDCADSRVTRVG